MTRLSLRFLAFSTAAIALHSAPALASVTAIYGGGATMTYAAEDVFGQCVGVPNSGSNPDTAKALAAGCTAPVNPSYEYLLSAVSSGPALDAFIANTASTTATKGGTVATDAGNGFGAYPYPSWQFSFSEAPLDSLTSLGATTTYLSAYTTSLKAKRGQPWQIPVAAIPVAIAYRLPTAQFGTTFYGSAVSSVTVSNSASVSATVTKLDLSTDALCYIWTQANAKGSAVSGTYTWDNPIFYGTTAKGKITNYDSNLVQSSVAGLAIKPVVRSDAAGATYLFALWLSKNCKGYSTAGYSVPAASVTFPSFVTAVGLAGNGTSGQLSLITANNGAVGYITPDTVLPAKAGGLPAAFLLAGKSKVTDTAPLFEYPTPANTLTAETGIAVPTKVTAKPWGAKLEKTFFKAAKVNSGYPITGLTYIIGYTCYVNDSSKNELVGVQAYLNFLGTTTASSVLTNSGFAPLTQANYTSEIATVNADLTGVSATPVVSGKKTLNGPKACKQFTTDAHDYN